MRLRCVAALLAGCATVPTAMGQNPAGCHGPEDLEQAVASHPSAAAWNALGAWFGGQNQLACAAASFEAALRIAPDSWESHYDLALALLNEGDATRAEEELRKTLRLKPGMVQARAALGVALGRLHRNDEAIAAFQIVLRADPKSLAALDGLSKALIEQKKYEQVIVLLKNRADEEPLALDLAAAYSGVGNTNEALQILNGVLVKDPGNLQARVNLGLVLAEAGRTAEAETALRKAMESAPESPLVLSSLAMVLSRMDRKDEAIELMRKASALEPSNAEAHVNLGIALADEVRMEAALNEFSEAVRLAPKSAVAHYNRGRLLFDMQRNDEARPELETSLKIDPAYAGSWYLLGLMANQDGKDKEAIASFRKVVTLQPKNAEAHYMLGRALLDDGDRAGAIAEWRETIRLQPGYEEALYNLARVLAKSDPQEAKAMETKLKNMLADQHMSDRAHLLGNFALASANAHDWPQAVSQLKEAIGVCERCSAEPQLHKDLGLIYCHSGDFKSCREELLIAQKLSPNDAEVRKSLQILAAQ